MKLQALTLLSILIFAQAEGSGKTSKKEVPEYPPAKVRQLLEKVRSEKKQCLRPIYQRPSVCRSSKLLSAFEGLLQSYLVVQERAEKELGKQKELKNKNNYLNKQTEMLRTTLKDTSTLLPRLEKRQCYKPELLQKLMLDEGITDNGGLLFSKHPAPGGGGECWTNLRRKSEGSINLCDYPLAIAIDTRGGSNSLPIHRSKEFLFALNGCDLLSVHITDSDQSGNRETYISYDQCIEKWNKRTADAAMGPKDVALMEDIIGFCFREYLLPPRHVKNGRVNPLIRRPASGPKPN